jgi:hypothetical protein
MSEVLQANIFFFIASTATVVFCTMVCVVLYYVIKILIAIRAIVERLEAGSDVIADDVSAMREFVKSGGLVAYLINRVSPQRRSTRSSRTKQTTDEEND